MRYPQALAFVSIAFLIAVALVAFAVTSFFLNWTESSSETDFLVFYGAGRTAARGDLEKLYDADTALREQRRVVPDRPEAHPFPYSATLATLFTPLSLLRYERAYALFFTINLVAIIGGAILVWQLAAPAVRLQRAGVLAFAGLLHGTTSTLFFGQLDVLLTLCLLASLALQMNGRYTVGAIAAWPLALKPQFLPGLLLYWALERRWGALAMIAVVLSAAYLWPLAVEPASLERLADLYFGFFVTGDTDYAASFERSSAAITVFTLLVGVAAVVIVWRFWRRSGGEPFAWAPVFILPLLLTPHGPRDIILVGALALMVARRDLRNEELALGGMLLVIGSVAGQLYKPIGTLTALALLLFVARKRPPLEATEPARVEAVAPGSAMR